MDHPSVFQLAHPVQYSNHIQPVCLPSVDNETITPPNAAWATGWGTTSGAHSHTCMHAIVIQ